MPNTLGEFTCDLQLNSDLTVASLNSISSKNAQHLSMFPKPHQREIVEGLKVFSVQSNASW
jgi:hypothetical protein